MKIRSMNLRLLTISACFSAALSLFVADTARAKDKFLALGGAALIGDTVCKLINDKRDIHLVRCLSYPTGGSVYNIQALTSGELDMAITRADLAYKAFNGLAQFASIGPNRKLRTVTNLYNTPIVITVRKDSGINSFDDFKGKVVNIGNRGSGKRTITDQMFEIMGWTKADFAGTTEFSTRGQSKPFCEKKVDILIEGIGLPSPLYDKLAKDCGAKFIDMPQKLADGFRKSGPFFFDYKIPASINPNNDTDVKTIGIKTVLLSLTTVSPQTIATVAESIFGEKGKFQKSHPALSLSDPDSMVNEGIYVPLHDGAKKYYEGNNLLGKQAN
jgi:TRAP transporter TAXI family solute receptor